MSNSSDDFSRDQNFDKKTLTIRKSQPNFHYKTGSTTKKHKSSIKSLKQNEDIIRNVGYMPMTSRLTKVSYGTNYTKPKYQPKIIDMFGHTAPVKGNAGSHTYVCS